MSVARFITAVTLTAGAVTLAVPVACADPMPPRPAAEEGYPPSGTLTVKNGDLTETWTWRPGYEAYQSSKSNEQRIRKNR
ncbi:hypothetical protein ACLQ2R_29505 [Streptosporangium sp. DT93]|uniref:hypothetical protein n=1 Tax=Streptosporangium sp. DT93 TaxID=3393428 RepID=UPI003CE945E1